MPFPWFSFNFSRYTAGGIVIGLTLVALAKAWFQTYY